MALWAKSVQLPPELFAIVESSYEKYFSTSVRSTLAVWLEKCMMDDVDADSPVNENYVNNIMNSFRRELQRQNGLTDTNPQLIIQLNGSTDEVIALFKAIRECLREESRLVDRYHEFNALTSSYESRLSSEQDKDFYFLYMNIISDLKSLDVLLYRLVAEIKSMNDFYQQSVKSMNTYLWQAIPKYNQNKTDNVTKLYSEIALMLHKVTCEINCLGSTVLNDKLIKWKIDHQKAANSGVSSYSIDTLQDYFAWIEDAIAQTDTRISTAECLADQVEIVSSPFGQTIDGYRQHNEVVLETLLANSAVVELEPRQVIINNVNRSRFQVRLRLLMVSSLKRWSVTATADCLSEEMMGYLKEAIMKRRAVKHHIGTGSLVRDSERCARLIFDKVCPGAVRAPHCKFPVSEQKFCLIFDLTFSRYDIDRQVKTRVTSLPMVFVNYKDTAMAAAWSAITWHNAFLTPEYNFLAESKKVPWAEVLDALAAKFKGATGIQLEPSHLQYLSKAFFANKPWVDYDRVCKEFLPRTHFTFWRWFYETIRLTKEYLTSAWKSGLVVGFASTESTMAAIARWKSAPFMIRFIDTRIAYIEVVYLDDQRQCYGLFLRRNNFLKMGIKNNANFVREVSRLCKTQKPDWIEAEISSEEFLEIVDSRLSRPEKNSVSTELRNSSIESQQDLHLPLDRVEENSIPTKSKGYFTERPKQSDSTFDMYAENSRSIESRSPADSLDGFDNILDLLFGNSKEYAESRESGEKYTEVQEELGSLFNSSEENLKFFESRKRPTTELHQLEFHPPFKKHKENSESNCESFTSKHIHTAEENQQFLEAIMETSNNSLDLVDELCHLSDLL